MDGVLVDSEPLSERAFSDYVESIGRPELAAWFPNTLGRRQRDFVGELADVLEHSAAEVSSGLAASTVRAFEHAALTPMPFVHEALGALCTGGRRVGLASSSSRRFVDLVLRELRIGDAFAALATGDEVERGKPAPDLYLLAAERLGAPPDTCIAIEDTPAGAAAAVAAGMTAIAVPNALTAQLEFAPPVTVVPDLRAAAALVAGWESG
jgi:HAD superfamily hydrolase (TIGR01509 family)